VRTPSRSNRMAEAPVQAAVSVAEGAVISSTLSFQTAGSREDGLVV
jgi:hypothetical protein